MSKVYWYKNLSGGMNQASDTEMVTNNESELLENVLLDQRGNWARRKGTEKSTNVVDSNSGGQGIVEYAETDGSHTFLEMVEDDLYKLSGNTWSLVSADICSTATRVGFANFLDRVYLGFDDSTTGLKYTDGSNVSTVTPSINGNILAVNKSILAVGGNSIKSNVIFYSDPFTDIFYSATGTCTANADSGGTNTVTVTADTFEADMVGAILYNSTDGSMALITDWSSATKVTTDSDTSGWDNDTVYVLQNVFTQDGEVTGIAAYLENFVSFDEDAMYVWDPTNNWSKKLPNYGCVAPRSIRIVDGYLIWVDREAVYMWSGEGQPIDISEKIKDRVDGYGLFNLINPSNWSSICAGSDDGKYYLSVGTLSTLSGAPCSAISNAEFMFDARSAGWTVNTRSIRPVCYSTFIDSTGSKDLYFQDYATSAVIKVNSGTTDVLANGTTQAIEVTARTPHLSFDSPHLEYRVISYYIKYRAGGTVTLKGAINHGDFESVDTLAASDTFTVVKVLPQKDAYGFTFSLELSSSDWFVIEGIGLEAEQSSFGSKAT